MSDPIPFALDERLSASTALVVDLPLCRVLLRDDARFWWLVLVPRLDGAVELADLPAADRATLLAESVQAGEALRSVASCDKLNIAVIGNVVRQLHMHVVARTAGDAAWPRTAWDCGPAEPCGETVLKHRVDTVRAALPT